jgi:hypothetical protein
MNIKRTALTFLVLAVGMIGSFAIAQQERPDPTNRPQSISAAELERLSAQPSLEQGILKIAAEKLRQEKRPMTTVEMALTVTVTKVAAPPTCWYQICVHSGTKLLACLHDRRCDVKD